MTETRQFGMRILVAADPPAASLVEGILLSAPTTRGLFLQDLRARGLRPISGRPVVFEAVTGEELPHRRSPFRTIDLLISAHVEAAEHVPGEPITNYLISRWQYEGADGGLDVERTAASERRTPVQLVHCELCGAVSGSRPRAWMVEGVEYAACPGRPFTTTERARLNAQARAEREATASWPT